MAIQQLPDRIKLHTQNGVTYALCSMVCVLDFKNQVPKNLPDPLPKYGCCQCGKDLTTVGLGVKEIST